MIQFLQVTYSTRRFAVCLSVCHFVLVFFGPFSIAITSLGEERELILVFFVRLFVLCLFRFVGFLFLLGSGKGCGLWLWHSLDFSLTFFFLLWSCTKMTVLHTPNIWTVFNHSHICPIIWIFLFYPLVCLKPLNECQMSKHLIRFMVWDTCNVLVQAILSEYLTLGIVSFCRTVYPI